MWREKFRSYIVNFNAESILFRFGVLPNNPLYVQLAIDVTKIINTEVRQTAVKLNESLIEEYTRAMYSIFEYADYDKYITQMRIALSNPAHIDVYYDEVNNVHAQFINYDLIGDVQDLIAIQKAVYDEGGTLENWIRLYRSWRREKSKMYEDIMNQRFALMGNTAPFLELVEDGNDRYDAYPQNGGTNVLKSFQSKYRSMMAATFSIVLAQVRAMSLPVQAIPSGYIMDTAQIGNKSFQGYKWVNSNGSIIFVKQGTESMKGNILYGDGFIQSKFGGIKFFRGRAPLI